MSCGDTAENKYRNRIDRSAKVPLSPRDLNFIAAKKCIGREIIQRRKKPVSLCRGYSAVTNGEELNPLTPRAFATPIATYQRRLRCVMRVAEARTVVHVVLGTTVGDFVDVVGVKAVGWCATFTAAAVLNRFAAVPGARFYCIAPASILRSVIEIRIDWRLSTDDQRVEPWHQRRKTWKSAFPACFQRHRQDGAKLHFTEFLMRAG